MDGPGGDRRRDSGAGRVDVRGSRIEGESGGGAPDGAAVERELGGPTGGTKRELGDPADGGAVERELGDPADGGAVERELSGPANEGTVDCDCGRRDDDEERGGLLARALGAMLSSRTTDTGAVSRSTTASCAAPASA